MDTERGAEFKLPPVDTKKGQMMLIYLPEGSVIVDRSNAEVRDMLNGETGGEVPTGERRYEVPVNSSSDFRRPEQIILHRHVRRNWTHIANVIFGIYVTLTAIVPLLLSTILGVSVFAAHSNLASNVILKGDLMVSHQMRVDQLASGDLVLLRDPNNWRLQVRNVTDATTANGSTTVSTNSGANAPLTDVFTLANNESIRFISSHVPILGYFSMILSSILVKVLGALLIVVLNIIGYFRRGHSRRDGRKMVLVSK